MPSQSCQAIHCCTLLVLGTLVTPNLPEKLLLANTKNQDNTMDGFLVHNGNLMIRAVFWCYLINAIILQFWCAGSHCFCESNERVLGSRLYSRKTERVELLQLRWPDCLPFLLFYYFTVLCKCKVHFSHKSLPLATQ